MSDPTVVCAVAYASYLALLSYTTDQPITSWTTERLTYWAEEAGDIADALRVCPDREVEIDFLDHIGRDMTNRIHRIEIREGGGSNERPGPVLRRRLRSVSPVHGLPR